MSSRFTRGEPAGKIGLGRQWQPAVPSPRRDPVIDALRETLQTTLGAAYTIERELGGGGMSRVFVADDVTLGRKVVVKIVAPEVAEGVSIEHFMREVKLCDR